MTINFQSLGWYLVADLLVIGAFRIYAPEFLSKQNTIVLFISSILLWIIFDIKKRR